ncbi:MAG: hypothetical protein IJE43_17860 [Alphaproteobacteria bacterium]|nr:hypothetical protein [Alphaproteobacteria bacterium]MBQ3513923.1 hypothetical protein [Lachnospiraceae bacterium]
MEKALLVEQGMRRWFNSDNEKLFDELLDVCSNAFQYWRYIYEKNEGMVHILFARIGIEFTKCMLRRVF